MKYIEEFRDGALARNIAASVRAEARPDRAYNLMEFCGGHTHAIARFGLPDLLPNNLRMIHGPDCPVCVMPIGRIDCAIRLAQTPGVVLCTYGDTLRVPASGQLSLMKAKARGADVRMVYSTADALKIARDNPGKEVVFFAIGFETTTPPTAVAIKQAEALGLKNFTVFCNHVLTPSAIANILEAPEVRKLGTVPLDGFIGQGGLIVFDRDNVVCPFFMEELLHGLILSIEGVPFDQAPLQIRALNHWRTAVISLVLSATAFTPRQR